MASSTSLSASPEAIRYCPSPSKIKTPVSRNSSNSRLSVWCGVWPFEPTSAIIRSSSNSIRSARVTVPSRARRCTASHTAFRHLPGTTIHHPVASIAYRSVLGPLIQDHFFEPSLPFAVMTKTCVEDGAKHPSLLCHVPVSPSISRNLVAATFAANDGDHSLTHPFRTEFTPRVLLAPRE